MKETLKKTFDSNVLAVVGVVFGIGSIFQFIVFPGLTASDTVLNILSLLVGIFSLLFLILTLTFGVSFTQVPSEPARAQIAIDFIQPKHEVTPLNFAKLHEVVD